ncbi:MAG: S41 family peptidase, partial [Verrucomicrobia bacterium]|nr:S41 family peptidase [Verrucomicrobiota bacterium]
GDKIIKINDQLTQKMSLDDAVKLLRGQPGTDVTITISRPSSGEIKEITITRAIIKVDTVKDIDGKRAFNVDTNKIGYVKLTGFGEQTTRDLAAAVSNFKKQDIKGLILDLRNNPGGLLSQAAGVCEMFLPTGQLVVSTEGRAGTGNEIKYFSRGKDNLPGVLMVVLVNGSSASASEIVAGCLQDCKRAIILGDQTFGKGSVQTVIPLPDDMALRLTTAKYYTPSHKVIHEKGITPDILVPMTLEEEEALYLKKLEGAEDVIKNLSEEKRTFVEKVEDIQLDRARDLLRGMMILESKKK